MTFELDNNHKVIFSFYICGVNQVLENYESIID